MKGKRLLINTVFLTATSLVLRMASLFFQVFLSRKMGAAGIGLFQLVLSVYGFAATVAISGMRFAATRLVSEAMGRGRTGNVRRAVKRCVICAMSFGCFACTALFLSAKYIGTEIIGDARTVLPLKILGLSLPFLSGGAVFDGYFTGVCRIGSSVAADVLEQIFKISVSVILLRQADPASVEQMCTAVVTGNVAGEILSFFAVYVLYRADRKRHLPEDAGTGAGLTRRMFRLAVPLAVSAYARTALNTVQNILIPKGFQKSGASAQTALSGYGTIQGMVFPIITFPAVIFYSISELIVPELTEEQVRGRNERISEATNMLLKSCMIFSVGVMGALLCFGKELGMLIYENADVGGYIRLMAFLMPVMYMDTVTDGMLRGLGEHMYSMRVNVVDSLACTLLIYFILPKYAVYGYIFILYASEILNFAFSIRKLGMITKLQRWYPDAAKVLISVTGAVNLTEYYVKIFAGEMKVSSLITGVFLFSSVYASILFLLDGFSKSEIKRMLAVLKRS